MNFAVIKTGGKQYLVKEGDILNIEKLAKTKGDKISFEEVLLIGDSEEKNIKIGQPMISGVSVEAETLDQFKDKKVSVVKFKSKIRYHRKRGHRQQKTKIKISKIIF